MTPLQYPVGGERQPVYKLMKRLGFHMSRFSDKSWSKPQCDVHIFGAGSMAKVITPAGTFECLLDDLEAKLNDPEEA